MSSHRLLFAAILALTCVPLSAQQIAAFSCTEHVADTPVLRAGGRSELIGEIRLGCSGGSAGTLTTDFTVYFNADYSGRILNASTNATESLLIVGDPASPVLGVNAFQGTLEAPNTLKFRDVTYTIPGGSGKLGFRIVNVRLDTYISENSWLDVALAFVSAERGFVGLPINNPQQIVGFGGAGLRFQLTNAGGAPLTAMAFTGAATTPFRVRFDEGSQNAFRRRNVATSVADPLAVASQAEYGRDYQTESGFYLPALNATAGLATQGTRLMATFTNLPAGVSLSVATQPSAGSSSSIQARLVTTAADGSGAYSAVTPGQDGTAPLVVSGGTAVAVWEVLTSDPAVLETLLFNVVATSAAGSSGIAGVSSQFAPLSTNGTPDAVSPMPRFRVPILPSDSGCGVNCIVVPSRLVVNYTVGGTAPAPLVIPIRSTGAAVSYQASVSSGGNLVESLAPSDAPWITLTPASGVTPSALTATINPAGLIPGKYRAEVTVTVGRFSERFSVFLHVLQSTTATAQAACEANAGVPPVVRSTGLAEQLGDLVLNCQGNSAITTDVRVTLNTNITSRPNDVLLILNEPAPFEQAVGVNVFRADRVSDTQVVFRNVALPLVDRSTTILRVTNLRADTSRLGLGTANIPSQVVANLRLAALPVRGSQQTVAFIQPGYSFEIFGAGGTAVSSLSQANGGKIRFREGFASSFRRRNVATAFATPDALAAQHFPGAIYNTETGFYNPALPNDGGVDMGLATQGTRLVARFSNVPAGMAIAVSVNELGAASPKAQLIQTDANGAGAFQAIAGPYANVPITNGSGVAVWEILSDNLFSTENFDFGLQLTGPISTAATVQGFLGPLSTVNTANATAPLPRFATANVVNPVCQTCVTVPASISLTSNGTNLATASVPVQSDTDPTYFTASVQLTPWLTIQGSSGTTPGQFTVTANPAGLAAGVYTTTILVNGSTIPLTFTVGAAGPAALLLPLERATRSFVAGTAQAPFAVQLEGTPGLAWSATADVPWLQLSPANGTVPASLSVIVNAALLPAGEYDGIITFTAPGAPPAQYRVHASVRQPSGASTISGVITGPGAAPRAGVTVSLSGLESRITISAADGSYVFPGLPSGGPYTVTPSLSGVTFTPSSRTFPSIGATQAANFTANPLGTPPAIATVTPATPFGSPQTFQIKAVDPDGAANIARVYFQVHTAPEVPANTCHGFYDRASNSFHLFNDALTALVPALENSQCRLGASSAAVSGNELNLSLVMSLKSPFADSARNLYLWVADNDGNGTGWQASAVWRPLGSNPPMLVSSSVVAGTDTVKFQAADPDNNLARAYFVINTSPNAVVNGCHGFYDYQQNAFFLYNDALTAFVDENSKCALDRARSGVANGEVTLALVRKGPLTATKVYLWFVDALNLGTGWLDAGLDLPVRTQQLPAVTNGAPASANGITQQFSARIDDPNTRFDLDRIYFLINPTPTIPQNSCHGYYHRPTGTTYVYNDALTAASSLVLENGQCRIQSVTATPVPNSDTGLTLSFTATRKGAYLNANLNVYLWAVDFAGTGTGWVQTSAWTNNANTPPTVVAPSVPALTGSPRTFIMTARDIDGAADINRLYFLFHATPSIPQNTCHGFYDKATTAIYLFNDALTALSAPLTPGTAQTIENSQCAVHGTGTSMVASATDLTLNLNVTLKNAADRNAYLWAVDTQNTGSGWVRTASWSMAAPNQAPTVVNSPVQYFSGSVAPLTFTVSDSNGAADISRVYFLVSSGATTPLPNSCHGFYDRAANAIFVFNDGLTALAPSLQNSQCGIDASTFRVTANGQQLILSLSMIRKGAYNSAPLTVSLWAVDSKDAGTGWVPTASWYPNLNRPPSTAPAVPAAAGGASTSFRIDIADPDGWANVSRVYFLVADGPQVTANSCHGVLDVATSGYALFNDALTGLVTGTGLQNSQCALSAPTAPITANSPTNASFPLPLELRGAYAGTRKRVYIWVVDKDGNGTGWVQVATWN